jgi:hypothetical protein
VATAPKDPQTPPEPAAVAQLVAQARAILDHGDDAPSWPAAFDLCRGVIALLGEER